jgi:hypothetical protein
MSITGSGADLVMLISFSRPDGALTRPRSHD